MSPHDGLDEGCDSLKNLESMVGSWAVLEVGEGFDKNVGHEMGIKSSSKEEYGQRGRTRYITDWNGESSQTEVHTLRPRASATDASFHVAD